MTRGPRRSDDDRGPDFAEVAVARIEVAPQLADSRGLLRAALAQGEEVILPPFLHVRKLSVGVESGENRQPLIFSAKPVRPFTIARRSSMNKGR